MDGSTYTNIFETKGIEYLIIILFLVVLIPFWIIVNKKSNATKRIHNTFGVLTAAILRIPQGLFYCKNHTWAYLEKSGRAKIGLDDFLLQIVGDVKIDHLKTPGERLNKGEILAEIDQNGKRLRLFSPVSGEIVNANTLISENPEMLNDDPYGNGWMYTIKPSDWKNETANYYLAEDATEWINKELNRFKDFLSVALGKHSNEPSIVVFQEGGELKMNPLAELQPEIWEDFQQEFLN